MDHMFIPKSGFKREGNSVVSGKNAVQLMDNRVNSFFSPGKSNLILNKSTTNFSTSQPVQRVIRVGGNVMTKAQLTAWKNTQPSFTVADRTKINAMRTAALPYNYASLADLKKGIVKARAREAWQANGTPGIAPNQTEKRLLSMHDPLYKEIHAEIMANHQNRPYATDALHETGALMGAWMDPNRGRFGRAMGMAGALFSRRTWGGLDAPQRPGIQITGIDALRNQTLMNRYAVAKHDIEHRPGGPGNANEQSLYSGHGPAGMNFIEQHGHDPSYGQYDPRGKGHGAHGRGAYFTDRVDKAVSYSASHQQPGEERSFFKQDVLLGHTLNYQDRGRFRHRHHNEMVRGARNQPVGGAPININRAEGQAAPAAENMAQYDSLTGQETAASGNGLWGTFRDRARFDSTEYMVRNADQVLPKYRIRYTLQ